MASKYIQPYNKEFNRIKRQVKRLQKRGYIVEVSDIVTRAKTINKRALDSISKKDLDYIYSKARYVDSETGEYLSGKEGRDAERRARAIKAAETRKAKKNGTYPSQPVQQAPVYQSDDTGYGIQIVDDDDEWVSEYDLALQRLNEYLSKLSTQTNPEKSVWANETTQSGMASLQYALYNEMKLDEEAVAYAVYTHEEELNTIIDTLYEESRESVREAARVRFLSIISGYGSVPPSLNERYTTQG